MPKIWIRVDALSKDKGVSVIVPMIGVTSPVYNIYKIQNFSRRVKQVK